MRTCPACGEENPDRFRLCGFCGTPLVTQPVPQEVRKTVTVVFSDLKGSTALGEALDSEAVREVLEVYFAEMRAVLERHGGAVEKYIGDAIMAVFGLPHLHEDDALRAVRAAHEMQGALERVNRHLLSRWGVTLENRTGVNTGEVVAGDAALGQRLVTGDVVNVAARLEQAAAPLEVLIGEPTYRLVRDAVLVEAVEPLQLKGKSELISAYRLLEVTRSDGVARRSDTPLVGRAAELTLLVSTLERVSTRRTAELVTVVAPAGTGKSRLLHEFLSGAAEGTTVLRGRCLSYGEGITFWPLAEVVRDALGIAEDEPVERARAELDAFVGEQAADVAERLAPVMGLSTATYPVRETFWAARRFLEIVSRGGPAVVILEDIHWAEPTFLDLITYVPGTAEDAPLLLLCTARPDLLELHPVWREETPTTRTLTLLPLSDAESALVVSNLLGEGVLAAGPRRRIVEAAQGNPLFVEQLLSMLIDDGQIRRSGSGWVAVGDLSRLAIPPTISALLTARLDRLAPAERAVLERASVIGQTFYLGAVESLCAEGLRAEVRPVLEALARRELVVPALSPLADEEAFSFQHVLIRDAAYQGLLKRTRADLHERFVDWIEAHVGDGLREYEEIRGYHLEQTFVALSQLGPLDAHGVAVGERGAGHLAAAGERARDSGDMPAASSLLRRAAALVPEGPATPTLLLHAGEALGEMGEFDTASQVLSEAVERAQQRGDPALATTASVVRRMWRYLADPESVPTSEVTTAATAAMAELERLGAHAGLARAWRLMTYVHFYDGTFSAAEESALSAVREAEAAGDRVLEVRLLSALASCVVYSPTPVPEAIERCREIMERAAGDRRTEAMTLSAMGHLEAMRGGFQLARDQCQRSRAMLTELGFTLSAAITALHSAPAEMLAGDLARAESELRGDYAALQAMGEKMYTPTVAGLLAEVLHAQGRDEEAGRFADVCRQTAAPHDVGAQYQWRCIRAKLLAREGGTDEAVVMAREGVRLIRDTDQPGIQGEALAGLAEVLVAAGELEEAAASLSEAISLFEQKGDTVSAARSLLLLDRLPVPPAVVGVRHAAPPVPR